MARKYELQRRAQSQADTRRRIVDATLHLHQTVGPAATTIAAVARGAGVSRLTVYRHFPDEVSLLRACTSTYDLDHPPPDPAPLFAIQDPVKRLETALSELYRYYTENEVMIGNGADSAPMVPALVEALAPMFEGLRQLVGLLAQGWGIDGGPGSLVHGGISHAIAFTTWRSLRREQGLTNDQAVRLMVGMVKAARDGSKSGLDPALREA